ncbi:fanconi-associated nuclease 1 isoform X2 [Dendroctonus ponderosae]|uniref:fanconi-associated nuclease 1 isoform X2 n=1 Tax=Dendroctonus ponderosae TaxID=77166 RepID=UPI0020351C93|nr:fanconi-associated nuclease 1 isoform X2 [Dendroctonus ponderosae]
MDAMAKSPAKVTLRQLTLSEVFLKRKSSIKLEKPTLLNEISFEISSSDSEPESTCNNGEEPTKTSRPIHESKRKQSCSTPTSSKKRNNIIIKQDVCITPKIVSNQTSMRKSPISSPSKNNSVKQLKAKEGKQLQVKQLKAFMDLFERVEKNMHLRNLLQNCSVLNRFKTLTTEQQYVVMKLFVWKKQWYNIYKFCNKAKIEFDENLDKLHLFSNLQSAGFLDSATIFLFYAEYLSDDLNELLNQMDVSQIKEIMNQLRIIPVARKKMQLIATVLTATRRQSTIGVKTLKDRVLSEIHKKLGDAYQIRPDICDAFNKLYVLATFTEFYSDIQDYFRRFDLIFPTAPIESYPVFHSILSFERYAEALKIKTDLESHLVGYHKNNKISVIYSIATDAYAKLRDVSMRNEPVHESAPHLNKFTSKYVYCKILSDCCQKLFTKARGKPSEVKQWLQYLIETFPNSTKLGGWYHLLIWINMRHLDRMFYRTSAEFLIEALDKKKPLFLEKDVFKLEELGRKLLKPTTKYQLHQLHHDTLVRLISRTSKISHIPGKQIDAKCIRSNNSGRKRTYFLRSDGETTAVSVEDVALEHYKDCGYPAGSHCEGSLIKALLILYFWDIIYNPEIVVRGSFISKWQSAPLDFFTRYFYENRKGAIDMRLMQIETVFSHEELINFGINNYQQHSHKCCSVIFKRVDGRVMDIIKDVSLVEILITVIGRKVLSKIFERLIKNLYQFFSGMPDLLIWNIDQKIHKFVEVKGEGDKLAPNQTLWLLYLHEIGASVEVCWVHSMGSKRKIIQRGNQNEGDVSDNDSD